jgi:hypothetical protein
VLQAVEDAHRAVLDAVFVTGDQASAHASIVGILTFIVKVAGVARTAAQ